MRILKAAAVAWPSLLLIGPAVLVLLVGPSVFVKIDQAKAEASSSHQR